MQFSQLTQCIDGEGAAAWDLHEVAVQAAAGGEDVIVLSVGDPDFSTPENITAAAIAALQQGDTHYQLVTGRPEVRQLIAERFQTPNTGALDADNVMLFAGAQNALFAASLCLLNAGDQVLALDPMYVTYEATIRASGAELVAVPQSADSGFRFDARAARAAITPNTKAILITNPNNPTGVMMSESEIDDLCALALDHDLWVISDEVYGELVFEGQHISIAQRPQMFERTVTLNSLSKTYAMTGWRVGWAIAPGALIAHFSNLGLCMLYGLPGFTQAAAHAALDQSAAASAAIRTAFKQRRDLVFNALSGNPLTPILKPQAGMFIMMDVRALGMDGLEFANALYAATGVAVLDAGAFGKTAYGWVRISYTADDSLLTEACARINGFIAQRQEHVA
ncbi:MAG: pyridoxal phosphate-dependent aminotransferase [Oceanospirillaceae bacterium]|jgi:polar amino acid transport system ATP-binding protein/arginine:pyruvate transaminase|nr:pyridoxal phosphate-dependent aminotransferase [Oceanospirillaceae bacterium]MBT4443808.1 pyridoxal phosphate-dependent aminotransferase [Oceanospirillaceae bacterium]MBT6078145.1 pyridoxal phosphate-dependent aminotransferase [Oceanospirillaceae bacterium]MBT7329555.1 pyridoxal phosphate-dependent aminotransferase [Oceanospirillaceae bacterium]